ncbi:J domain-containing protein [Chitinophagales bacterium]|nr:J domain-containing protein [Chitinophagales bacterium]
MDLAKIKELLGLDESAGLSEIKEAFQRQKAAFDAGDLEASAFEKINAVYESISLDGLIDGAKEMAGSGLDVVTGAGGAVVDGVGDAVDGAKDAVSNASAAIVGGATNVANEVVGKIEDVGTGISEGVSDAADATSSLLMKLLPVFLIIILLLGLAGVLRFMRLI